MKPYIKLVNCNSAVSVLVLLSSVFPMARKGVCVNACSMWIYVAIEGCSSAHITNICCDKLDETLCLISANAQPLYPRNGNKKLVFHNYVRCHISLALFPIVSLKNNAIVSTEINIIIAKNSTSVIRDQSCSFQEISTICCYGRR